MNDFTVNVLGSRIETEMNLVWADNNPELFVKVFRDFQTRYPATVWSHRIDISRKGFVTLIANRRMEAF